MFYFFFNLHLKHHFCNIPIQAPSLNVRIQRSYFYLCLNVWKDCVCWRNVLIVCKSRRNLYKKYEHVYISKPQLMRFGHFLLFLHIALSRLVKKWLWFHFFAHTSWFIKLLNNTALAGTLMEDSRTLYPFGSWSKSIAVCIYYKVYHVVINSSNYRG